MCLSEKSLALSSQYPPINTAEERRSPRPLTLLYSGKGKERKRGERRGKTSPLNLSIYFPNHDLY